MIMQLLTRKFTVEQFHQMAENGILNNQERIELIQGDLITMSPIGYRHAFVTTYLSNWFVRQLGERSLVSTQNPIQLDEKSEPQPDLVLLKPTDNFYGDRLPRASDCLLLIEVADSSLIYDQTVKIPLYAQHHIPEVWLINLNQQQLECHTNPVNNAYQQQEIFRPGQQITSLAFPDLTLSLTEIFG
jgi:Uma2 family endonuclease